MCDTGFRHLRRLPERRMLSGRLLDGRRANGCHRNGHEQCRYQSPGSLPNGWCDHHGNLIHRHFAPHCSGPQHPDARPAMRVRTKWRRTATSSLRSHRRNMQTTGSSISTPGTSVRALQIQTEWERQSAERKPREPEASRPTFVEDRTAAEPVSEAPIDGNASRARNPETFCLNMMSLARTKHGNAWKGRRSRKTSLVVRTR